MNKSNNNGIALKMHEENIIPYAIDERVAKAVYYAAVEFGYKLIALNCNIKGE